VLDGAQLKAPELQSILTAFDRAARQRKVKPGGALACISEFFEHDDLAVTESALRLAGTWKVQRLRKELEGKTADDNPRRRRAAVAALVDLGGPASEQHLATLAASDKPYAVRAQALVGLTALDAKRAAMSAAQLLRRPTSATDDPGELYIAFLQRTGGAQALAEALRAERPSADAAKVGLRTLNTLGAPAADLQKVLEEAAGVGGPARKVTPAEVQRLLSLVQSQGDAHRGEAVFRRAALGCLQCHAIAGAGSRVGPDLSGIGSSAQLDYLLESILLPGKVIREGYNTAHIVTTDGRSFSGVVVRETPEELVLRNPTQDELVIAKRDIEERNGAGSLMPEGLDQLLTDAELADLVRFLSELGRPGPFATGHAAVARRWQYLATVPEALVLKSPAVLGQALRNDAQLAWSIAYSKVSGELPLAEVRPGPDAALAVVHCEIDVATAGRVTLQLNSAEGLRLWLDGAPVEVSERIRLEPERGIHTLDVSVDLRQRKQAALRCELVDGQARFVGGK
jgi:putative heme-binding domain-containing protein